MASWTSLLQRPPQENPYQAEAAGQQQALTAQAMMQQADARKQQAQLADQQIQEAQLKVGAEQKAAQQADAFQRAYVEGYSGPDAGTAKVKQLARQYGASPDHVLAFDEQNNKIREGYAKAGMEEQKLADSHLQAIGKASQQLLQLPPDVRAAKYPEAIQELVKNGHLKPEEGAQLIANPLDENSLRLHAAEAKNITEILNDPKLAADTQEAQGKALLSARSAAAPLMASAAKQGEDVYARAWYGLKPEVAAYFTHPKDFDPKTTPNDALMAGESPKEQITLRKTQLEGDELQHKLDLIKNSKPTDVLALVDQVIPPGVKENTALNARTKAMVSSALAQGDIKGAQDAIKTGAAEIRQLEVATDPRVQAGKVAVTIANANARNESNLSATGQTNDDFKRAGEEYARTGVMPQLGRDSVSRGKIQHFSNEWARDNNLSPADIITMRAAYHGDKKSLEKLQSQRDQIISFENTATKNLDLFLNAADKIPDTGVPWINAPIRTLDEKLVGSANMAAVNAARQVANNEIAKVTSGGGLSGVLSDSARKEVSEYNPRDATFAQTKAVAKVLKQDMANRHSSLDNSLTDIKSRIGGSSDASAAPPLPKSLSSSDVGKTFTNATGKKIKITAVNPKDPTQFKGDIQ